MDQVVEEIANPFPLKGPGEGICGVIGMLATTQLIMRRNMSAAPLRSMGSNRTTALYSDMRPCEITRVLQAMRLVTDNPHIATSLNRLRTKKCPRGAIVTHVSDAALLCGELNGDVCLQQCGAQSYAIAQTSTLNSEPSTLNPQPSTLHPQPPHPTPFTPKPKP